MISSIGAKILELIPLEVAYAHCDIPCGIYDPHAAQLAAHTIIRMTQLISEIDTTSDHSVHDIARMTRVKEKHGEMVENELGTLENDYFKEEHYKTYPELKGLLTDAVVFSVKTRQHIDMPAAEQLLDKVMLVAEIFYKTKNVEPVRVKAPYPTGRDVVVFK